MTSLIALAGRSHPLAWPRPQRPPDTARRIKSKVERYHMRAENFRPAAGLCRAFHDEPLHTSPESARTRDVFRHDGRISRQKYKHPISFFTIMKPPAHATNSCAPRHNSKSSIFYNRMTNFTSGNAALETIFSGIRYLYHGAIRIYRAMTEEQMFDYIKTPGDNFLKNSLISRKNARNLAIKACSHIGIDRLFWQNHSGIGSIFMLHRVTDRDEPILNSDLTVHVQALDRLIRYVKGLGYEIVSLDEIYRRLANHESHGRFLCFTFDDGYADNYHLALPLFRHHDISMTIYITTGFLDRTATYWWGGLERLILQNDSISIDDGSKNNTFVTQNFSQKSRVYNLLVSKAHENMACFEPIFENLFRQYKINLPEILENDALSVTQARELAADPLVEIGAHGMTHRPLASLGAEQMNQEIRQSRAALESRLDTEVRHFAYPFGTPRECGPREIGAARQAGFATATTTNCGNIFFDHREHLHCLPRLPVTSRWIVPSMARLQLSGTVAALKRVFAKPEVA